MIAVTPPTSNDSCPERDDGTPPGVSVFRTLAEAAAHVPGVPRGREPFTPPDLAALAKEHGDAFFVTVSHGYVSRTLRSRGRSRQQTLPFREHGGARAGAGRKPTHPDRPRLRHAARPTIEPRYPVHITTRVRRDVTRLRRFELCKVLRRAFVYGYRKGEFRICQFSIQGNQLHLICEAAEVTSLARGVQGWAVRIARGLNGYLGRTGAVFDDRYHVELLTTPTQIRNALCYVLLNARRHGERLDARFHGADPCSSAWWFDGWKDGSWKLGLDPPESRTVSEPKSWLLRTGWKRAASGLLAIDEIPAAGRGGQPARRRTTREWTAITLEP